VFECAGICQWEDEGSDYNPIGFCSWLVNAEADGCTSDCEGDALADVTDYITKCGLCLDSDGPYSVACNSLDDDNCFNDMDFDTAITCDTHMDADTCEYNYECHWNDDEEDGEGHCEADGPPACVWDCAGICEWEDGAHEDPLGFCSWLVNAEADGCTSDCEGDALADVNDHMTGCAACLATDNPESDECQVFDDGGYDDCYCSSDDADADCDYNDYDDCSSAGCD
jgi:hypothetical protein